MSDLFAALGLALAIEGTLYALAPRSMRQMAMKMLEARSETLRFGGLLAVALGVGIVWLVRAA